MFENYPTFIVKLLYNILFFSIVYIVIEFIIAKILYSPFIKWWEDNNGEDGIIDFTSFALFNKSKITFDLYQQFILGNVGFGLNEHINN